MKKFLAAMLAGGALAYFLDPARGTRRRNMLWQRLGGMARNLSGDTGKAMRNMAGDAYGVIERTIPHQHDNPEHPDNVTLKDRVESEVLRNPKFSRAPINFNVVDDSVVVIHGELPHPEDIDQLIKEVKNVRGVTSVESYLHLPNTPAPNKLSAIRVD